MRTESEYRANLKHLTDQDLVCLRRELARQAKAHEESIVRLVFQQELISEEELLRGGAAPTKKP